MEYCIFCDESCYLENDSIDFMSIGGIWCPKDRIKEINRRIKEIKEKYNYPSSREVKWSKISNANKNLYLELINFFFDYKDISFRIIVIDKKELKHNLFNQTHDDFYYKMYFLMLNAIFDRGNNYDVYVDIKDTHSYEKCQNLLTICRRSNWDFQHEMIRKIQPIRSEESQILQLADILIGAVTYANRLEVTPYALSSKAKLDIIHKIRQRSGYKLIMSTYLSEKKMNIFRWEGNI